jgi:hypothetical protein
MPDSFKIKNKEKFKNAILPRGIILCVLVAKKNKILQCGKFF